MKSQSQGQSRSQGRVQIRRRPGTRRYRHDALDTRTPSGRTLPY
ncbi:hypothetical protein ACGFNU_31650 [Spirillospora sp. NPDC048911]